MQILKNLLFLAALLIILPLNAQHHNHHPQEVGDSLPQQHIEEITVRGLFLNKLNFPYDVMSGEEIESHGFITPAEALHHVPGVNLSRDGIWATSVNIRGFRESKLLFLNNGDRMLSATDLAGVLSTVDMGGLDRIEVVKGAGSVLYGSGAMGGVVNLISARPGYSDHFHHDGNVSSGFHAVNNLWDNGLRLNFTDKDWYIGLTGSFRTAGNTMTPEGVLLNSQFNDASWGLKGGMKRGDNQELLVDYNHFQAWNVGLPGGSVFPETALVRYLGFTRNQLSGEYIFTDLTTVVRELSVKAYTQNVGREVENLVNPKLAIFPGSMNVTSGVKATADLYFNDYNTMTVGAETWVRDQKTQRLRINETAQMDTVFTLEQPTPDATMLNTGVFGHYKLVIDPKYWTLNAGLRLDYIRTANDTAFKELSKYQYEPGSSLTNDRVKTELPHDGPVLFPSRKLHELAYSAHVDLVYQPLRQHKLILSLANAYRSASMEERFKYIDQAGILRVGNPSLKPEKGFFSNLSYGFNSRKVSVNADVFANYLFDLITEELGTYQRDGQTAVQAWVNTNIDRAFYYGGEIQLRWMIADELTFETHMNYVMGKDVATGEHLPLIPPLHGIAALHYHWHDKLGMALEMDWEYEGEEEHGDEAEPHRHAIFSLSFDTAERKIAGVNVKFFGGVKNLLNTAYEEHLSSLRGINRLEPGRNIYLKAKVSW